MTRDEILSMKPGRELDALVAEKVMLWRKRLYNGFEYWDGEGDKPLVDNWSPSTDMSAAGEVAEKLQKQGYVVCIELLPYEKTSVGVYEADPANQIAYAKAQTPAEAICKAALLAVMGLD